MVETRDIKINCCALILAILTECSQETAFEKMQSSIPMKVKPVISQEDIKDMRIFREEGMIYREIGSYYGATKDLIYSRLNPREKKDTKKIKRVALEAS